MEHVVFTMLSDGDQLEHSETTWGLTEVTCAGTQLPDGIGTLIGLKKVTKTMYVF